MTTLIAIETSAELASIALLTNNQVESIELSGTQTHSGGVIPAIQTLLSQAGLKLSACDAIAFGCGPGAFTGVRTACGIVQGMAYAANLPVIPISSLLAVAHQVWLSNPALTEFSCVLDARMSELFWARYTRQGGRWVESLAPQLASYDNILLGTPSTSQLVCGPQVNFSDRASLFARPHAKDMVWLAQEKFLSGEFVCAEEAQPLYVRNKIALTTLEREQEKRK